MTNGNENQISVPFIEWKAAIESQFAAIIGDLIGQKLDLKNQIKQLQADNGLISQLMANETDLVNRIQELESEIAGLKYQLSSTPKPLSPKAAALAAEGSAILADDGE